MSFTTYHQSFLPRGRKIKSKHKFYYKIYKSITTHHEAGNSNVLYLFNLLTNSYRKTENIHNFLNYFASDSCKYFSFQLGRLIKIFFYYHQYYKNSVCLYCNFFIFSKQNITLDRKLVIERFTIDIRRAENYLQMGTQAFPYTHYIMIGN